MHARFCNSSTGYKKRHQGGERGKRWVDHTSVFFFCWVSLSHVKTGAGRLHERRWRGSTASVAVAEDVGRKTKHFTI